MDGNTLRMIGAAILTSAIGAVPLAGMAGDGNGVVILQREVVPHPAYRQPLVPGRTTTVDVSPDDKVNQAVQARELGDKDFAAVNSGVQQTLGRSAAQAQDLGLSDYRYGSSGANGGIGGSAGAVQTIVPVLTGEIGPAVGAATGAAGGGIARTMGTLNGLTGAIMRTGGQ